MFYFVNLPAINLTLTSPRLVVAGSVRAASEAAAGWGMWRAASWVSMHLSLIMPDTRLAITHSDSLSARQLGFLMARTS